MQRLAITTLGALVIGIGGFIHDSAAAQTPARLSACSPYESTIYFAPGSSGLSTFSGDTIHRVAQEARACGASGVIVEAAAEGDRATTVATALRAQGLKAVIVPAPLLAPYGESIVGRSVTLRVAAPGAGLS